MTEEQKNHILAFLPVLKELEAMGYDPIRTVYAPGLDLDRMGIAYAALMRAKAKYPKWDAVISKWIAERMAG